jgi:hypothetical protein
VKDVAALVFVEYADAGLFLALELYHLVVVIHSTLCQFILGCGHVKVVIEVAPIRRHPLETPAHAILKRFDLRQRRPWDGDECYVVVRKVNIRAIDMVNKERAAFATLLPVSDWRTEHEMVDDQLTPSVE